MEKLVPRTGEVLSRFSSHIAFSYLQIQLIFHISLLICVNYRDVKSSSTLSLRPYFRDQNAFGWNGTTGTILFLCFLPYHCP
jgi:hypothetical protein